MKLITLKVPPDTAWDIERALVFEGDHSTEDFRQKRYAQADDIKRQIMDACDETPVRKVMP